MTDGCLGELKVTVGEARDGVRVVSLDGELDLASGWEPAAVVLSPPTTALVVDMTDLAFMDLAGVRALLRLVGDAAASGAEVRCVIPPDTQPLRVLTLMGDDRGLDIHPTLDEALASLRGFGVGRTAGADARRTAGAGA